MYHVDLVLPFFPLLGYRELWFFLPLRSLYFQQQNCSLSLSTCGKLSYCVFSYFTSLPVIYDPKHYCSRGFALFDTTSLSFKEYARNYRHGIFCLKYLLHFGVFSCQGAVRENYAFIGGLFSSHLIALVEHIS